MVPRDNMIDQLFKENLAEVEIRPEGFMWESIKRGIATEKSEKKRMIAFWKIAAAVAVIGGSVALFQVMKTNTTNDVIIAGADEEKEQTISPQELTPQAQPQQLAESPAAEEIIVKKELVDDSYVPLPTKIEEQDKPEKTIPQDKKVILIPEDFDPETLQKGLQKQKRPPVFLTPKKYKNFSFAESSKPGIELQRSNELHGWTITAQVSPDFGAGTGMAMKNDQRNAFTAQEVGIDQSIGEQIEWSSAWTTGVKVGKELGKRTQVQTGLLYAVRKVKRNGEDAESVRYLEVPALIRYDLAKHKYFDLYGATGIAFNFLSGIMSQSDDADLMANVAPLNIYVGTGLEIGIGQQFAINVEPAVRYALSRAATDSGRPIDLIGSLNAGLNYSF